MSWMKWRYGKAPPEGEQRQFNNDYLVKMWLDMNGFKFGDKLRIDYIEKNLLCG